MLQSNVKKNSNIFEGAGDGFFEYSPKKLLFNSDKCKSLFDMAYQKAAFDPTLPISIELHLTNRCNLNCVWCVDKGIRENRCDLPYSALIRFLDDIAPTNIGITVEGGGEPTIYSLFEDFVLEAARRKIALGLITNGVQPFCPELVKHFHWIRVSLDASTPREYFAEKGADRFESVLDNLEEMCRHKRHTLIGVGYVLTKRNYKNIPGLLQRIQEIGVDYIQMRAVEEDEVLKPTPKMLSELQRNIRNSFHASTLRVLLNPRTDTGHTANDNLPCIAHSLRSIIHADGSVHLCEKRRHDPITLGNITESSFMDIWNSPLRREASEKLLDPCSQAGCTVCRITKFNHLFFNLINVRTKNFI